MAGSVGAPAVEEDLDVGGDGRGEVHLLAGGGVTEAEGASVEGLTGAGVETVLHEGFVGSRGDAAQDLVATIAGIVEQRVADMAHVHADLVGATGFEHALDGRYVGEVFEGMVVSDSVFALRTVGEDGHLQAVA